MAINPESTLLVPRKRISFSPSEGKFVPISDDIPDFLKQPLVRDKSGTIPGLESGWRSGLLTVEGQLYKAKGSRPLPGRLGNEPKGTQTYSLAQYESDQVMRVREMFIREDLTYPIEPVGYWVYDLKYKDEPTAATLYRVQGDTRLDELIWYLRRIPEGILTDDLREKVEGLFRYTGQVTGYLLKLLHNNRFSWDTEGDDSASNAHAGNIVVFPDSKGSLRVGLIDFDNAQTFDPEDEEAEVKKSQQEDLNVLQKWVKDSVVVSGARARKNFEGTRNKRIKKTITKHIKEIPGLSESDEWEIQNGLLTTVGFKWSDPIRDLIVEGISEGYSSQDLAETAYSWSGLGLLDRFIKRQQRKLNRIVQDGLQQQLQRADIPAPFDGYHFLRHEGFPIVIRGRDDVVLATKHSENVVGNNSQEGREREILDLCTQLLNLHQANLVGFPTNGKDYFSYPPVSDEIVQAHSKIDNKVLQAIIEMWIHSDLKGQFEKQYDPKVIGSFMITLTQVNVHQVEEALEQISFDINESDLIDKLIHLSEIYELMPKAKHEKLRLFLDDQLFMDRHQRFNTGHLVELKSAISLLGLGIITSRLHDVFNHRMIDVYFEGFSPQQITALKAGMDCPELLDPIASWGDGEYVVQEARIALTGAQVRNGQMDNLAIMPDDNLVRRAAILQYFFASKGQTEITDAVLMKAMEVTLNNDMVTGNLKRLIITGINIHPNSFFADTLRKVSLEADEVVAILKTALDVTGDNLDELDPIIRSLFSKKYEGVISAENAGQLVLACIGLGVELPEDAEQFFNEEKNRNNFMNFISTEMVSREGDIYWIANDYPVSPVYSFISSGMSVLPERMKALFEEYRDKQGIINNVAIGLVKQLFSHDGYFRKFFGGMSGADDYPKPSLTMKDMLNTGWQMWRIVHSDIWNILFRANPSILADYINKNIEDGKVDIEFTVNGVYGKRTSFIHECLPPDLYEKISPLIAVKKDK